MSYMFSIEYVCRKLCKINEDHTKICEKYCFEECSPCEEVSCVVKPDGNRIMTKCGVKHQPSNEKKCIIS